MPVGSTPAKSQLDGHQQSLGGVAQQLRAALTRQLPGWGLEGFIFLDSVPAPLRLSEGPQGEITVCQLLLITFFFNSEVEGRPTIGRQSAGFYWPDCSPHCAEGWGGRSGCCTLGLEDVGWGGVRCGACWVNGWLRRWEKISISFIIVLLLLYLYNSILLFQLSHLVENPEITANTNGRDPQTHSLFI